MHSEGWSKEVASPAEAVSEQEARAELDRLIADPDFACTDRNKRFLRFVAEATLEGRQRSIKAYAIAVDVFGRASSFDPVTDPIVRIEATRLRAALSQYYARQDKEGRIRIELPKGHYIPVFHAPEATEQSERAASAPNSAAQLAGPQRPQRRLALWSFAAGFLMALLAWVNWPSGPDERAAIRERPSLAIEMEDVAAPLSDEAGQFRDTLTIALSRFRTVQIEALRDVPPQLATGSATAALPMTTRSRYALSLKYRVMDGHRSVYWQIVNRGRGTVMQAGEEHAATLPDAGATPNELGTRLAARLASAQGVINQLEAQEERTHPSLGNGCTVRSLQAVDSGSAELLNEAQTCLRKTLQLRPADADAHAMLAIVLLKQEPRERSAYLAESAGESAARAMALAPDVDRSQIAQMLAQFRIGHHEAAIAAGRRALELNPYNPVAKAELGRILFILGRWDEGIALVMSAEQSGYPPTAAVQGTLAFNAYRLGSFTEALLRLEQSEPRDCYVRHILKAATLAQLDRVPDALREIEVIEREQPNFQSRARKDLNQRQYTPSLVSMLAAGLAKAGIGI
ncbi:tetratricopeptide repeat protein [Arvimicrobium flavum]|uniref:tetratricopeptide repeat protein n=1 Tax=Arvimicrobium flavum TaxID=3393320 RepID=UPI00237AB111|nr:hypothetical protein [Mesorhizobium shangrilense]